MLNSNITLGHKDSLKFRYELRIAQLGLELDFYKSKYEEQSSQLDNIPDFIEKFGEIKIYNQSGEKVLTLVKKLEENK